MKRLFKQLSRRDKAALLTVVLLNIATLTIAAIILNNATIATAAMPSIASPQVCSDVAARLLIKQNLAGTVMVGADNILRVQLTGQDMAGQWLAQPSDVAWDVLPALLVLPRMGCGPYPTVQIDVPFNDAATRLLISADWVDVRAWGYGELDDSALAQRLQTILYTPPR